MRIRQKPSCILSCFLVSKGKQKNAITLVEVLVVIAVLGLLMQLLLPAVRQSRGAARKITCANNLRQLMIASSGYIDLNDHTPKQQINTSGRGEGYGNINSLVFLLPFLEQQSIYDEIDFSVHGPYVLWGDKQYSPDYPNAEVVLHQVDTFLCPVDSPRNKTMMIGEKSFGNNSYTGNVGWPLHSTGIRGETGATNTQFGKPNGYLSVELCLPAEQLDPKSYRGTWQDVFVTPAHITDGLSKTVAYSERIITKKYTPSLHPDLFGDIDLREVRLIKGLHDVASQEEHYQTCANIEVVGAPKSIAKNSRFIGASWFSGSNDFGNTHQHLMTPNTRHCSHYYYCWWSGNVAHTPSSWHPGGVYIALADGSVRFVTDDIDRVVWWALGSRDAGDIGNLAAE